MPDHSILYKWIYNYKHLKNRWRETTFTWRFVGLVIMGDSDLFLFLFLFSKFSSNFFNQL